MTCPVFHDLVRSENAGQRSTGTSPLYNGLHLRGATVMPVSPAHPGFGRGYGSLANVFCYER
jgi:hypothetical protein